MHPGGWKSWAVALVGATLLIAPACSDDPAPADAPAGGGDGHDHSHDFGETTDNFAFILGVPGDAASATRTVKVDAEKEFAFSPKSLQVDAGETITFEVTNSDEVDHEFVLGNRNYQDLHESQLKAGGVYHDYSAYSVHVGPGQTASVTWTFKRSGRVLYACHVPGHYDEGMFGEIRIS